MVRSLGKGAKLLKLDIEHAFRIIRVNVQDFNLLGMYFNGYYYVDKALPFGLSYSRALLKKLVGLLNGGPVWRPTTQTLFTTWMISWVGRLMRKAPQTPFPPYSASLPI